MATGQGTKSSIEMFDLHSESGEQTLSEQTVVINKVDVENETDMALQNAHMGSEDVRHSRETQYVRSGGLTEEKNIDDFQRYSVSVDEDALADAADSDKLAAISFDLGVAATQGQDKLVLRDLPDGTKISHGKIQDDGTVIVSPEEAEQLVILVDPTQIVDFQIFVDVVPAEAPVQEEEAEEETVEVTSEEVIEEVFQNTGPEIDGELAFSMNEDGTFTITEDDLLANASDADGHALAVSDLVVNDGVLVDNNDGTWTFTPDENFNGDVELTYTVSDGFDTVEAKANIEVAAVNDAAEVSGDTNFTMDEDGTITLTPEQLLANASDVEGDDLTVSNVAANGGTITENENGTWTYEPAADFNGSIDLTYDISDGTATTSAGGTITVDAVNDTLEVSGSTSFNMNEDGTLTITEEQLLANTTDVDGDDLSVSGLTANGGTLTDNNDGTWTFEPTEEFSGTIDLSYNVSDGTDTIATSGSINVAAVNDGPTAVDDQIQEVTSTALSMNGATKLNATSIVDDPSTGDQVTVSFDMKWDGSNSVMPGGFDTYDLWFYDGKFGFNTGNGDIFGIADTSDLSGEWHTITAVFTDGDVHSNKLYIDGVEQDLSQVRNSPNNGRADISEEFNIGGWGRGNGYEFKGEIDNVQLHDHGLTTDEVSEVATGGVVENGLVAHYDFEGDSAVTDQSGNGNDLSVVRGSVQTVEVSREITTTSADGGISFDQSALLANDSDIEGDSFTLTDIVIDDADLGTVSLSENGTITYNPSDSMDSLARGETQEVSFTYTITDDEGAESTATATITVTGTDDAPVLVDESHTIDADNDGTILSGNVLANDSDVDDGSSFTIIGAGMEKTLDMDGSSQVTTTSIVDSASTGDQVTVSFDINWDGTNSVMPGGFDTYDLWFYNGNFGFNTGNGDIFGISDTSDLSDGWHTITAVFTDGDVHSNKLYIDGVEQDLSQVRNSPNNSRADITEEFNLGGWGRGNGYEFSGEMDNVQLHDHALSADEVAAVNNGEVVTDGLVAHYDFEGNAPLTDKSGNGNDATVGHGNPQFPQQSGAEVDGTTVIEGDYGTLTIQPDGSYTYDLNESDPDVLALGEGDSAIETFNINVVENQSGVTGTEKINITVNGTNEGPVVSEATSFSVNNDQTIVITEAQLLENASDVDGDTLTISNLSADGGTLTDNGDGTWTYDPVDGYEGNVNISYDVSDGTETVAASGVINVEPEQINTITGTSRSETLRGTADDDMIIANEGNDNVRGGDGADTIIGGTGNDNLYGDAGDDTFLVNEGDGADDFYGGEGTDKVISEDGSGVTIDAHFQTSNSIEEIDANGGSVRGDASSQVLDFSETTLTDVDSIDGGAGNDRITGSAADDTIAGGTGNDDLFGGAGDDTFVVNDGDGADDFFGGEGTDKVVSEDGSGITIDGHMREQNSIEEMDANGGAINGDASSQILDFTNTTLTDVDSIDGGAGNDRIYGAASDDTIVGGTGNDDLYGNAGNDTFLVKEGDGADDFFGGDGTDKVVSTDGSGVTIDGHIREQNSIEEIDANGGAVRGDASSQIMDFTNTTLTDVDSIDGGAGNDRIYGSDGDDIIVGGTGNDDLYGGGGDDTFLINEGDGVNDFFGGEGTDKVISEDGHGVDIDGHFQATNSIEEIDAGGNSVRGDASSQVMDFSETTLTDVTSIDGGAGNDRITGSTADDTIVGGTGNDDLYGNAGNDTFLVKEGDGADDFFGGEGVDKVVSTDGSGVTIDGHIREQNSIEEIDANGGGISGDASSQIMDFTNTTLTDVDSIDGGAGNDRIYGSASDDTIIGGTGNDDLYGGDGNDTFLVKDGDGVDDFFGGDGTDKVVSTDGSSINIDGHFRTTNSIEEIDAGGNSVSGDASSQILDFSETTLTDVTSIDGGAGNDRITGTDGDDTIVGGTGNDDLYGGAGNDTFLVNEGDGVDDFFGGEGTDKVISEDGSGVNIDGHFRTSNSIEEIDANGGNVSGDASSQIMDFSETTLTDVAAIDGGAGNDRITGTDGDDLIIGGAGNDRLDGGEGNDIFHFGEGSGNDIVDGGEGWMDTVELINEDGTAVSEDDWTIELSSGSIEEQAEGYMELSNDAEGTITFADGSELTFDGVERFEW
ncbi:cadherin-like domain-containing protein [Terasakiella sp. A23]|uniref:cadherin-like domain-containing protein n=1 Tax=Terasakiella sp. FCG-A23 TaxID=3080561 RepID=UPI002954CA8A|nr:cadherin-like domain-containing protein [Terasakiella sp. A23]MDV7340568.1 cadherin-like domain-containing protein [Terasakiella sp. A23]